MAKFLSKVQHFVLQDGPAKPGADTPSPWAVFVDHVFHTNDAKVADRLRSLDPEHGVTEVSEDDKSDAPADAPVDEPAAPAADPSA